MSAPAEQRSFDDHKGLTEAVIAALAQCRQDLFLVDRDLRDWPFERPEVDQALAETLRRGACLRLLITDTTCLERRGTRFMRTRRTFDQRVHCRRPPELLRLDWSALVVDRRHLIRRAPGKQVRGHWLLNASARAQTMLQDLEAAWEQSETCLPSTVLGLAR